MTDFEGNEPHPNYVLMPVSKIWSGSAPNARPGWAMGDFFGEGDLRRISHFEIKEWHEPLVQREWRNHRDQSPEYISVNRGVLTVELGGVGPTPEGSDCIELSAGTAIVLRPGLWRRFKANTQATGISVRSKRPKTEEDAHDIYTSYLEHWKHTDHIRQLLLYNFLMAGSIMILAWAALDDNSYKVSKVGISALGLVLSAFWLLITHRADGYYGMYEQRSRELEKTFAHPESWPFHRREQHRQNLRWWQRASAGMLIKGVPILFGAFFLMTLARPTGW